MDSTNPVAMVRHVRDGERQYDALMFCCPGCKGDDGEGSGLHILPIRGKGNTEGHPSWTWDGNLEAPTVEPSILTKWGLEGSIICHSYLRNGVFEYLGDCTHKYANQKVALPPLPDWIVHDPNA